MKRAGILNAELNAAISRLGHLDVVIIADCGLPLPAGATVIDLALVHGVPRFEQVLDALVEDAVFERCILAEESRSSVVEEWLMSRFDSLEFRSHVELKELSHRASLFIRTGEATPFANAALVCGVPF